MPKLDKVSKKALLVNLLKQLLKYFLKLLNYRYARLFSKLLSTQFNDQFLRLAQRCKRTIAFDSGL